MRKPSVPEKPSDLAKHALIGFDEETPFLRAASKALPGWRRNAFTVRTDSDLLVRVLPYDFTFPIEMWVAMHEDRSFEFPRSDCEIWQQSLEGLQVSDAGASATTLKKKWADSL